MKTKLYFFLWVCLSTLLIACVDDDIEPDVVPVTGVSLNKTALALDEGESESLIATVIPDNATNKKVTWKSSDTSVATVNASGKVTAQGNWNCSCSGDYGRWCGGCNMYCYLW